jgi:hypothetical protein
MSFWRLEAPDYRSDYQHAYVNGSLDHPFGMPGVRCSVCGATWGGSRTLPYECPPALCEDRRLRERWPLSLEEHRALQREVLGHLRAAGVDVVELRPGDTFQPGYLDVPSRPRADFLWSSLETIVVAERIRLALNQERVSGVTFCPVRLRRIGSRNPSRRAPMPATGEPEDLVRALPLEPGPTSVGPYFEMIVLSESGHPPGGEPTSICPGCGRPAVDDEARQLVMRPSMWRGADIFFLATTLHVVVTERVKGILGELGATNVTFTPYHAT